MYTCGVLTNSGNYKGMGDSKFVPNLDEERLGALVLASEAAKREPEVVKSLWERCRKGMFSLDKKLLSLGLGDKVWYYTHAY